MPLKFYSNPFSAIPSQFCEVSVADRWAPLLTSPLSPIQADARAAPLRPPPARAAPRLRPARSASARRPLGQHFGTARRPAPWPHARNPPPSPTLRHGRQARPRTSSAAPGEHARSRGARLRPRGEGQARKEQRHSASAGARLCLGRTAPPRRNVLRGTRRTDVPSLRSRIRGERCEGEGEGNPSRGVQAQGKEEREVGHGRHERHYRSSVAASIRACEVEIEGGRG